MKKVDRSELSGVFESSRKMTARDKFEKLIDDQIRGTGRVPVLDKNTEWFIHWNEENDSYDFTLYMYSVYVGPKQAKEKIVGYMSETGELIYA